MVFYKKFFWLTAYNLENLVLLIHQQLSWIHQETEKHNDFQICGDIIAE